MQRGELDQQHQGIAQQLTGQQRREQGRVDGQRNGAQPEQGQAEGHQYPQALATGKVERHPTKFGMEQGQQAQQLLGVARADTLAALRFQQGIGNFQLQRRAAIVIDRLVAPGDGLHRQDEVIVDGV